MAENTEIRILVLDDELFMLKLHAQMLANLGFASVSTAQSGHEALAKMDEEKEAPDLILLDLSMPAMDGLKLLRFAVAAGMDKNRIVILSGRDADFLHEICPMGTCLAVLNKFEARRKSVLDMVFNSLNRKAAAA